MVSPSFVCFLLFCSFACLVVLVSCGVFSLLSACVSVSLLLFVHCCLLYCVFHCWFLASLLLFFHCCYFLIVVLLFVVLVSVYPRDGGPRSGPKPCKMKTFPVQSALVRGADRVHIERAQSLYTKRVHKESSTEST